MTTELQVTEKVLSQIDLNDPLFEQTDKFIQQLNTFTSEFVPFQRTMSIKLEFGNTLFNNLKNEIEILQLKFGEDPTTSKPKLFF